MVLVAAPETTTRVALAEPRVHFKHLLGTVGFKHGLSGLNGILLGNIDREMHVISAKAEIAEFKSEAFEIPERLGAGVNMRLLPEAVVVAFGLKHHRHPVIPGVTRNLFRATARYILQNVSLPVAPFRGQAIACRVRQKSKMV